LKNVVNFGFEPVLDLARRHGSVVIGCEARSHKIACLFNGSQDFVAVKGECGAGEVGLGFLDY
jgi:hypothetical protein